MNLVLKMHDFLSHQMLSRFCFDHRPMHIDPDNVSHFECHPPSVPHRRSPRLGLQLSGDKHSQARLDGRWRHVDPPAPRQRGLQPSGLLQEKRRRFELSWQLSQCPQQIARLPADVVGDRPQLLQESRPLDLAAPGQRVLPLVLRHLCPKDQLARLWYEDGLTRRPDMGHLVLSTLPLRDHFGRFGFPVRHHFPPNAFLVANSALAPSMSLTIVILVARPAGLSSTVTRGETPPRSRPPCWMASITTPRTSQAMPG